MSARNIYFISDLHLGAGYIADRRAHEARVVSFLNSIKESIKICNTFSNLFIKSNCIK